MKVIGKWTYRLQHQVTKQIIERNFYHLKPTHIQESQHKRTTTIESKTVKRNKKSKKICEGEKGRPNIDDNQNIRRYLQRQCQPVKRFGFERL